MNRARGTKAARRMNAFYKERSLHGGLGPGCICSIYFLKFITYGYG